MENRISEIEKKQDNVRERLPEIEKSIFFILKEIEKNKQEASKRRHAHAAQLSNKIDKIDKKMASICKENDEKYSGKWVEDNAKLIGKLILTSMILSLLGIIFLENYEA